MMKRTVALFGLAALALAVVMFAGSATAEAQITYTLVPIPDVDGSPGYENYDVFYPTDINIHGDVAGWGQYWVPARYDFADNTVYSNGGDYIKTKGMNDDGWFIGQTQVTGNPGRYSGYYIDGDTSADVNEIYYQTRDRGYAWDINNNGVMVGGDDTYSNYSQMWTYTVAGGFVDHGSLNPGSYGAEGVAINDAGNVAGHAYSTLGRRTGFFWDGTDYTPLTPAGGGGDTYAKGMSENNNVLLWENSPKDAYIWNPTDGFTNLGDIDGTTPWEANAVNSDRQAVGKYINGSQYAAWVYDPANGMRDLTDLDITYPAGGEFGDEFAVEGLEHATAINELGWIAGYTNFSRYGQSSGNHHGWILVPVPEPGSLMLLASGGLMLLLRRRR